MRDFVVVAPRGLEGVVADEVRAAGGLEVEERPASVAFGGELEQAYRLLLWSRVGQRVLVAIARGPVGGPDGLYAFVRALPWAEHADPERTLAVRFTGRCEGITDSQFGALRVKDAICDRLVEDVGSRPSVDRTSADLRVHVHVRGGEAVLSVDLAGESLHRRGYRSAAGEAPLKENLAAGLLVLAGWPEAARVGAPFLDPMCGSGTLPIEAAMMAADFAPGLLREGDRWGFLGWLGHDAAAWKAVVAEARKRDGRGRSDLPPIVGFDADKGGIGRAKAAASRAGVGGLVRLERRDLSEAAPDDPEGAPGVLVVNPPYGERLGSVRDLMPLHGALGDVLKRRFAGWTAHVLAGHRELAAAIGLRTSRKRTVFNGALECRLLTYPMTASVAPAPDLLAAAFANRLRKRARHLQKWARRTGVSCYRIYDRDLPEYAVAVDRYEDWIRVQEREPPPEVDARRAAGRLREVMAVLPKVLGVDPSHVNLVIRRRQRGGAQYERRGEDGELHEVHEWDCRFLLNFKDYLDPGLFLDHREIRRLIGEIAKGRRFLNLFAYTGAASVHAARGGALETVSVDLSRAYLDRARRNLELNGFGGRLHQLVRADCLDWLRRERGRYGVILLDPPTFSTSKRMATTLDIQRDHPQLLRDCARLLEPDGVLLFTTHRRGFRLQMEDERSLSVEEITDRTLPEDFKRSRTRHRAWRITRRR